ncbi:hypothetical protein V6N11_036553 [Hibiscus sabdariffa]|uniref:Uncharacterized protein n=1 Tax=Hibiscus sabdariffa TaxID=183260 RepID=A0ABR2RAQ9_9ROSI
MQFSDSRRKMGSGVRIKMRSKCWRLISFMHSSHRLVQKLILPMFEVVLNRWGLGYMRLCDFPHWNLTSHGQFSVHSAYSVRMGVQFGPTEPLWKAIAGFKGIPRIRTFICVMSVSLNRRRCIGSPFYRMGSDCNRNVELLLYWLDS